MVKDYPLEPPSGMDTFFAALGCQASVERWFRTYPPDPLPLLREGGIIVSEGADAPSGFPVTLLIEESAAKRGAKPLLIKIPSFPWEWKVTLLHFCSPSPAQNCGCFGRSSPP